MKILIVSTFAPPHVGGLEVIVAQQAKSLAEMGHDVTVCTSRHAPALGSEEQVDGYRVIRVRAWNNIEERTLVPFPLWGPRSLARLARLVTSADLVHIHDVYYQPTFLAALLARCSRRPLFVTQHVSMVEHDSPLVMAVQRLVYATAARLSWKWCLGIVAYNVIVLRFLVERGVPKEKIRLSYNGIDLDIFQPGGAEIRAAVRSRYGLPPNKPLVLFVGRLVPKKGYRELMAAHDPAYEIVLAGPGTVPDVVPPNVTFIGPVSGNDLVSLYQGSDLFAFPAVGEMLTLSMQEAMACGLPVVAKANSAYDTYRLDPTGIALIEVEPDVLRKKFLEVLSNKDLHLLMATYSRRLARERFDWRFNALDVADIYRAAASYVDPPNDGSRPVKVAEALGRR